MNLSTAVRIVAILNFTYFFIEFSVGLKIGSVSLFADSIDFLEDGMVNMLILIALGWSAKRRSLVGMMLALILLVPGIATLWTAWTKFQSPIVPAPLALSLTGSGALIVNFSCATMLVRFREHGGSLSKAAFLSARNDVLANIAIVLAGVSTAWLGSILPDLLVGIAIAVMNVDAAREVWNAARKERREAASMRKDRWDS